MWIFYYQCFRSFFWGQNGEDRRRADMRLRYTTRALSETRCTKFGAILCKSYQGRQRLPMMGVRFNIPNAELFFRIILCTKIVDENNVRTHLGPWQKLKIVRATFQWVLSMHRVSELGQTFMFNGFLDKTFCSTFCKIDTSLSKQKDVSATFQSQDKQTIIEHS